MAIELVSPTPVDPILYDKVFLVGLSIKQKDLKNTADQPLYKVSVIYKLYAILTNGDIVYKKDGGYRITLPDYLAEAYTQAGAGDTSLLLALGGIENALTSIINTQGQHGTVITT